MLALFRFLGLPLLGFRSRLPLLPDQGCQGFTDWKLVSDGLDNVLQFIFATTKGAFFVPRRNGEIERKNEGRGSGVEGGNRVSWLEGRGEMHNTSSQSALFHSSP